MRPASPSWQVKQFFTVGTSCAVPPALLSPSGANSASLPSSVHTNAPIQ